VPDDYFFRFFLALFPVFFLRPKRFLGFVSKSARMSGDVGAGGLGLGALDGAAEAPVLPPGIHPALLVAGALVGAAPGGLRRQVETALPHDLAVGVGAAVVVAAVGAHRHSPILSW
jgi:hypothetical protein